MSPAQIAAVTLLVEESRRIAYGYTPAKQRVLQERLMPLIAAVEKEVPLYRRGLDQNWIIEESK